MSNYLTEQQQIEHLTHWWKRNGTFVLIFLGLMVLTSMSWQIWHHKYEKKLLHASDHYERLLEGMMTNNPLVVQNQAHYILKRYPNTPYALMASLIEARQSVNENNLPAAEEKLRWVMEHASNKALKQVARLRVARVMLSENKADQALVMLKKIDDESYLPAIQALTGDIYLAMGQKEEARDAYKKAIQSLSDQNSTQSLLQMKLDDLAS